MIINFIKFKLGCVKQALLIFKSVCLATTDSNWLNNTINNRYTYRITKSKFLALDSSIVLDMNSIPISEAYKHKLPLSLYLVKLHTKNHD